MNDRSTVDLAVIRELKDVMGVDFPRLVTSFINDGQLRLSAIQDALVAADAHSVRHQAHSFKGSSGNLGATGVSALCLEMENAAREGDLATAGTLFEPLGNAFQRVCEQLREM